MKHFAPALVRLLFPPACPLCSTTLPQGYSAPFCPDCYADFTPLPAAHCPRCALPFAGGENSSHLCGRCVRQRPAFEQVFAVGIYAKGLRHAIHQFKFNQRLGLDRPLAALLDECIDQNIAFDRVIPVPLAPLKLRQRGYNQALLLAREFARRRNLPVEAGLLCKVKETPDQHGLSARQRETNLRGAFTLEGELSGETILLIDDVLTTGKTAEICTQVLLRGGAGKVYVAVIGRAP